MVAVHHWTARAVAPTVLVRFRTPWQAPEGARYQVGEVVSLSVDLAALVLASQLAGLVDVPPPPPPAPVEPDADDTASPPSEGEEEEPIPMLPTIDAASAKALDHPPAHTMIRRAPRRKQRGGR